MILRLTLLPVCIEVGVGLGVLLWPLPFVPDPEECLVDNEGALWPDDKRRMLVVRLRRKLLGGGLGASADDRDDGESDVDRPRLALLFLLRTLPPSPLFWLSLR
mgnify:CR=1 FL=1